MLKRAKRVLGYIHLKEGEGNKGKALQLWEMFLLAVKYRFSPMEYEDFGFFRKEKDWAVMRTYLSNIEVREKLRKPLYDQRLLVILNNKLLFNRFFTAFGFPLPELYGCLNPESGFLNRGGPLRSREELSNWLSQAEETEMFVKPVGGLQGFNAFILKKTREGKLLVFEGSDCYEWSPEKLYDHLFQDIPESRFYFTGYLFEKLIKQHPALSQVNESSVNTCRILTIKTLEGTVETPFALMRFGRSGKPVDNINAGGIAAGIDLNTGILRQGTGYSKHGLSEWFSTHPDSGAAIEGLQVPFWSEVQKLAIGAASVMPGIKTVGWDVAITEEGPLLVEGNSSWTPIVTQKTNQGLLTPRNLEIFNQYGLKLR